MSDMGAAMPGMKTQYDLLLTQCLVLQPLLERNLYGRTALVLRDGKE
jgi:uncharacterized protein involved in copper resistance